MQSNDYFAVREHVNCVPDLAAFRAQAPLSIVQFTGQKQMRRYVRFMQRLVRGGSTLRLRCRQAGSDGAPPVG